MEEELEVVPRALSTAKFLMTSVQEPKEKKVWDAATRKVVTVVDNVQSKDLASSDLQRFLPWSASPNRPLDTPADGNWTPTSTARSRRGSSLHRTMDESQGTSPKLSDASSDDAGSYEGTTKPGVSHGRRRHSSLLMSEQHSGESNALDPAAYPGSLQPRTSGGTSHGNSRRSSALLTQEQPRRLTSVDPVTDAAATLGPAASPQPAPAASRARRSSMTVVDLQKPAHLESGSSSGDVFTLFATANAKQGRRRSLQFNPQDFENRMSQLVSSLSTPAPVAEAPAGPDDASDALNLRPDRRSRSLDTLWEQASMPAGSILGTGRAARPAPGLPGKSPQGSAKSPMHSAASLASVGRRSTYDIGVSTTAAAGRVTPLPLHLLADPVGNHSYHKSTSAPLPAAEHAHKAERVNRSKTGFSSSGSGQVGSSSEDGAESGTDADDSKSGATTIRRYVPQIHKIDKLALQRGGESDCTAYDSLLDVTIAQGLPGL